MIFCVLGRHGDLVNCLPMAYALSRQVGRVNWLVSHEYEGTLEGASYVNAVRWNGGQDSLHDALRTYANANPICAQAWLNPDPQRLTPSYALEQWRLAGMLELFGSLPLIFDRQNLERANALRDRVLARRHPGRPLIIACVDGVSSPFRHGPKLLAMLRGLDTDVIDLRDVRAERVFDLLPLFDAADCLVTIDTLPLHLARACTVPTVCLLNDDWNGWRASVPPPQCVWQRTYSEAAENLGECTAAVEAIAGRPRCETAVVVAHLHDTTSERAIEARKTWPDGWLAAKPQRWLEDSPTRRVAYMRDILARGLQTDADVVIWTNDDCALTPGALDKIKSHCSRWDFGCVRRDPTHMGRESFFFRRQWLADNIAKMPDVVISSPMVDLALAKWLRGLRGIKTTRDNLSLDFPPVELPAGLIYHAPHESSWLPHQDAPSARWNQWLFDAA
jgi:hypothetical protein